jgi:Gpi18-like mannosyltransferase
LGRQPPIQEGTVSTNVTPLPLSPVPTALVVDDVAGTPELVPTLRSRASWAAGVFLFSRVVTLAIASAIALTSKSQSLVDVLSRWDGGWYLAIVRMGYSTPPHGVSAATTTTMAFFPGYPLSIRALSFVTMLSPAVSGIVISIAAGTGAAIFLWLLASRLEDARTADRTVILFSFFPSSFVLSMVYADGLFIMLAAIALLAIMKERWLVAGMAAGMATFVRPNAIVLAASLLWAATRAARRNHSWSPFVAPLLAPAGLVGYFAFLYFRTGSGLTFLRVQSRYWHQRFDFGISNMHRVFDVIWGNAQVNRVYLVVLALAVIGTIAGGYFVVRWRPPAPILLYLIGIAALAWLSSNTASVPRFLFGAFPVLIPVAKGLSRGMFAAVVVTSAVCMVVLFAIVSTGNFLPA